MALVDAFGREMKAGRPVLEEIARWPGTAFPTYPSRGLTPEALSAIFMEADQGDVARQCELYGEMEEKDAHLGAVLATRKLAVAGLDWLVAPASEDGEHREVAEFVTDVLNGIPNWDEAVMDMLDAVGKGFSVLELIWELSGGKALISELRWRAQQEFTFAASASSANSNGAVLRQPRILTQDEPVRGEELISGKFIVHSSKGRSGERSRAGVLRPCAWMYVFKHYTLKDWLLFCERYAQPMRVGKFAPGTSEAERQVLRDAVFNMGTDAAAVISESTVIELLDAGQKGTAEIYESLASYCDRAISKAVLGQTLTTEHSSGSYAAAKVHETVRRDLTEADASALARTITSQVITPLVRYNFGPETAVPQFRFEHKGTEDLKVLAETLKTLGEMGVSIPASYVRERFGIPAEDEGGAG
ncbi:MAG: DUF935 domain-containing protein [Thermodesulfovibrionales bacterium]|nr:DUF935 domain-containing protein [Thermodesulfovibrionales bacterium]